MPGARSNRQALAALVALAVGGCGAGEPRCASSLACAADEVCDPSGRCAALRARRFVPTRTVAPIAWAVAPPARPARDVESGDALPLGGHRDLRAMLSFPTRALDGDRAVLALRAHPDWPGPAASGRIAVRLARPFRAPTLAVGEGQPRVATPVARRAFEPGHRGLFLVSLGPLLGQAGSGPVTLEVAVEGGADTPWRLASPDALDPALRPSLEVEGVRADAPGADRSRATRGPLDQGGRRVAQL